MPVGRAIRDLYAPPVHRRPDDTAKVRVLEIDDLEPADRSAASIDDHPHWRAKVAVFTSIVALATIIGLSALTPDPSTTTAEDFDVPAPTVQDEDTRLLHPIGGPVDTVERFISALNYGDADTVRASLAPDARAIEMPFLRTPPERITGALRVYRAINAVIEVFGCRSGTDDGRAGIDVICAIAYDSDFVRALGSENLRGTMRFVVSEGGISAITVPHLDLPAAARDVDGVFGAWLADLILARR
jgi:hypothetical protein